MDFINGITLILVAGILQGLFVAPMTFTRDWEWEHSWAAFSFLGMWIFNWALAFLVLPNPIDIYRIAPPEQIVTLLGTGLAWGVGAILFGIGMSRLGMALGYPIIMGLIAAFGALLPLFVLHPQDIMSPKGACILLGIPIAIAGIVFCARAADERSTTETENSTSSTAIRIGIIIAIFAGILSCLPNVGMTFTKRVAELAEQQGASATMANNIAWAMLFTAGGLANLVYCFFLVAKHGTFSRFGSHLLHNWSLAAAMGAMWIGSFYLYGMGAGRLGEWGGIIGWPIWISIAIVVGNLCGLWRGEWNGAPNRARTKLAYGLTLLIISAAVISAANRLPGAAI